MSNNGESATIKTPEVGDVWKHKEKGFLARVTEVSVYAVGFLDTLDGCNSFEDMKNSCTIACFTYDFIFLGKGKPLDCLFEVQDEHI